MKCSIWRVGDVGRVEVVEHDHDGPLLGGPADELRDRIEQPALPGQRRVEERVERAKLVVPADEEAHPARAYPTPRSGRRARF
jgi:hypothetical protein